MNVVSGLHPAVKRGYIISEERGKEMRRGERERERGKEIAVKVPAERNFLNARAKWGRAN